VRLPLPATASHSVPGSIPAVLAWHCSRYYVTVGGQSSGERVNSPTQPVAPNGAGAIRYTSPSILAVGDSE
jgi:hypothetical protein